MLATMCGGKIVDKLRCKYDFDCFTLKMSSILEINAVMSWSLCVVARVKHTGALLEHMCNIH